MASFSFGAGNARKLIRIPLYLAGRLCTLVIPRSRDRWVFGCGVGIGDGALALWEVVAQNGHPALWLVGSDREAKDAAEHGIAHVRRDSIRGFWHTARGRVTVVTHGLGDVNRYAVSGAFIVQLWHGIPLKRIGLDSPETVRSAILPRSRWIRALLTALYRLTMREIRLLPAASHLVRGRLESAFAVPDGTVPVTGEPRVDVLSQGAPESRRKAARDLIENAAGALSAQTRLVLYVPTWRDGEPDPTGPSGPQWRSLVSVLDAHDAVLLVRSHPLGAGQYAPDVPTQRVRPLGATLIADVTPALPALDVLVTDYSSLAFDAALVPLPVLYLAPDVDAYERRRGFYGTYEEVAGPDWAADWGAAAAQLDTILGDDDDRDRRIERSRILSEHVHAFRDGGNTLRVYGAIRAGLRAEGITMPAAYDQLPREETT